MQAKFMAWSGDPDDGLMVIQDASRQKASVISMGHMHMFVDEHEKMLPRRDLAVKAAYVFPPVGFENVLIPGSNEILTVLKGPSHYFQ